MMESRQVAEQFFYQLYDRCNGGFITLWESERKETYWFHVNEYERASDQAIRLSQQKKDVYFGVGLRKERLSNWKRGSAEDVLCIPGVWMDIDIQNEVHSQQELPTTVDEARSILGRFAISPSILVHSGYGLHAYWKFYQPKYMDTIEQREKGKRYLASFQRTIQGMALYCGCGWKLDNTSDLSRMLRVPGTMNYKGDPIEVTILYPDGV